MRPPDQPTIWVGRSAELALVRDAVDALRHGRGSLLWVEGEPGIGKSTLVARALGEDAAAALHVLWGTADQVTQRFPLGVMLDCLEVATRSTDPRRARTAQLLQERRMAALATPDAGVADWAEIELLVSLVDELCVTEPTAIVLDDLQWADEASIAVWHRLTLAVDQLPLLLVATCRPVPRSRDITELRASVVRRGCRVLTLGSLPPADTSALVLGVLGADATPEVERFAGMGNPLFLRELLDATIRDRIAGSADRSADAPARMPLSLHDAVNDRLRGLPGATAEVLRTAAILGTTFRVSDLAAVLGETPSALADALLDAAAAGMLVSSGTQMSFRHPLIRQALHDGIPTALQLALHGQAATALAEAGADPLRVAEQLLASGTPGNAALREWLARAESVLTAQAPAMAVELLQREVEQTLPGDRLGHVMLIGLARALLTIGRHEQAVARARVAVASTQDPELRAVAYSLIVRALSALSRNAEAMETIEQALAWPALPDGWRARLLALRAMHERASDGDLEAADATAREALRVAEQISDSYAMAHALLGLWLNLSVERRHGQALECVERALAMLGDGPENANLRALAVDSSVFTLQNLARWGDAESRLKHAREMEQQTGHSANSSNITAAVLRFWLGQWDDALAELGPDPYDDAQLTYFGLREKGPLLLWHGIAALIMGRRNQREGAAEQLRVGLNLPVVTVADRENRDFLVAAESLAHEQRGDIGKARDVLSATLHRQPGEMTLVHQWLPDLVRLCLAADDRAGALAAVVACQAEADAESEPARASAAADHCAGLFYRDPNRLRAAVDHHRAVGSIAELAAALEDLAIVIADLGDTNEARIVLAEAAGIYESFGAEWDISRAYGRARPYGIRRGVRGARKRPRTGWEALTPTERRIAAMVGEGLSTVTIAQYLFLSRRTVQTHISSILLKLGLQGRVEIAREVYRHTS